MKRHRLTCRPGEQGFTLIEMSIVLVLIALIAGGVITGANMIRDGELKALVSETMKYKIAVNTFDSKYGCLPGDCYNASTMFPGVGNGNGNGQIYGAGNGAGNDPALDLQDEPYMVWQHLAAAGLITGIYSGHDWGGQPAPTGTNTNPSSWNCPKSLGQTCPMIYYGGSIGTANGIYNWGTGAWMFWQLQALMAGGPLVPIPRFPARHIMQYGYYLYSSNAAFPPGVLSGADLLSIDTKIDDGLPFSGDVQTTYGWTMGNTGIEVQPNACLNNGGNFTSGRYNSSFAVRECPVIFIMDF